MHIAIYDCTVVAPLDPRLEPIITRYLTERRIPLTRCGMVRPATGLRRLLGPAAYLVQEDIRKTVEQGSAEVILIGFTGTRDKDGKPPRSQDETKEEVIVQLTRAQAFLSDLRDDGIQLTPVLAVLDPDGTARFLDPPSKP